MHACINNIMDYLCQNISRARTVRTLNEYFSFGRITFDDVQTIFPLSDVPLHLRLAKDKE